MSLTAGTRVRVIRSAVRPVKAPYSPWSVSRSPLADGDGTQPEWHAACQAHQTLQHRLDQATLGKGSEISRHRMNRCMHLHRIACMRPRRPCALAWSMMCLSQLLSEARAGYYLATAANNISSALRQASPACPHRTIPAAGHMARTS